MDAVVHLRAAVCLLGRFPALAGIDLDVASGEVLLVTGPNGAGKTTLLRAIAGLVPVAEGEATVLGHDLRKDRRAVRRHVGLLGHGAGLYEDLTVEENIRFWARGAADVDGAMARAGVDGRVRNVVAARLSSGQRRRTALAVLLARAPELWLLDEPHAGLDAAGRDVLDGEIAAAAARGTTVVLASHEVDRVAAVATRTVVVAGGQVHASSREPVGVA
ncbi:MAG TPA: heme ABC exporter ATP-binding protein CcmA [Acidimicrobiales bacterium]|nr:heme ABC exporter ATP-binding protein CcmA [Acidimicrobiales bacterium]